MPKRAQVRDRRAPRPDRSHSGTRALRPVLCAVWLALGSCALDGEPGPNRTSSYRGEPQEILEFAADLLRRQGYTLAPLDVEFLQVQGERVQVARRAEGSLARGTIVTQQVFVDASEDSEAGTRLNALFTVLWRQPSGLRRTWVPESAVGQGLRDEFYAALHAELGDDLADEAQ